LSFSNTTISKRFLGKVNKFESLFSEKSQGELQSEKVILKRILATGNADEITSLELIVHDMGNPTIKYAAK